MPNQNGIAHELSAAANAAADAAANAAAIRAMEASCAA